MITLRMEGADRLTAQLGRLKLTPAVKRRVLRKMGNTVAVASRKRITAQTAVSGERFTPRKDRSSRAKLLRGFKRQIHVRIEGEQAVIYVGKGIGSKIARAHQEGFTETVTAKIAEEQERRRRRRRNRSAAEGPGEMATRRQARRLKELGFKKSQKHIMANLTRGQAGAIIRKEEGRAPKKSWTITVPARAFLGASVADRTRMTEMIRTEMLKGVA